MEEIAELRAIPGYGMRPSLRTLRASWCGGINSNPSTLEAEVGGLASKPGGNAQRAQVNGMQLLFQQHKGLDKSSTELAPSPTL